MIETDKLVDQWPARGGQVQHRLPITSDSWSPTESPVARYIKLLGYVGIKDPTEATHFYEQALMLREASLKAGVRKHDTGSELANRLAQRDLRLEDLSAELADTTAKDAYEKALQERQVIYNAVRASYAAAVRAVHKYGEANWMKMLRPLVAKAVEAQDQARWDLLHKFAGLLRSPDLAGLAMVTKNDAGLREFDEMWRYTVGRPDLYHYWRLSHAERSENIGLERVGQFIFTIGIVTKGPHPKLSDMDSSWKPGLYTAAEVIQIKDEIHAEQQAVRDRAASGELADTNGDGHERQVEEEPERRAEAEASPNPPNTVHPAIRTGRRQVNRG